MTGIKGTEVGAKRDLLSLHWQPLVNFQERVWLHCWDSGYLWVTSGLGHWSFLYLRAGRGLVALSK